MVHLILTGATGLVGSAVLKHVQTLPSTTPITKLTILSRSPVPAASTPSTTNSTKIEVINHTDYTSYPPDLLTKLSDARAIIWAQGVSQTQAGSDAAYTRITKDFPVAATTALAGAHTGPKPLTVVYVSGEGATHTPGRLTPLFGRVKGEAELSLLSLAKQQKGLAVYCPRPGGIWNPDAAEWAESQARQSFSIKMVRKFALPVYKAVYPSMLIPTPDLAKVLVDMALREGGEAYDAKELGPGVGSEGRVLQNVAIRRLAGL